MNKRKKSVVLFHSTNYAIWAENELRSHNIDCCLISVPRRLSSDCGYCLEIDTALKEKVREILISTGIEFDRIEVREQ